MAAGRCWPALDVRRLLALVRALTRLYVRVEEAFLRLEGVSHQIDTERCVLCGVRCGTTLARTVEEAVPTAPLRTTAAAQSGTTNPTYSRRYVTPTALV